MEVGVALGLIAPGARTHVGGHHVGAEGDPPSEVVGPPLPVRLLGVEEEAFVERPDRGEGVGPQHQDRADQEIGAPTQATETERLQPGSGRRGERPTHPCLLAGDWVDLGRGHAGQVVTGPEPFLQPGDGVGTDRCIGIEEQQIIGGRVPAQRPVLEADVHARPRTRGSAPGRRRWPRGARPPPAPRVRGVVDDHDGQLGLQPVQTSVEEVGCAERHHQDVDATGHQRLRRSGLEGAGRSILGRAGGRPVGRDRFRPGHCL